jgi:hypothetical protein
MKLQLRTSVGEALVWVMLLVGAAALTVSAFDPDRSEWVQAYCAYGAKTEGQFFGCVERVRVADVERSAECARDGGESCSDAGPYWQSGNDSRALGQFVECLRSGRDPSEC